MGYLSVKETAQKWEISERSVRNYCQNGRIAGAFIVGKTWSIPDDAVKPSRITVSSMLTSICCVCLNLNTGYMV